jgi:hypothetical protein
MKDLQKAGGSGALLQALYFFAILLIVALILPGQGFTGLDALNDPARVLPFWSTSPVLYVLNLLDLPNAVGLTLLVLALDERLHHGAATQIRLATAAGLVAVSLFLATGMTAIIGMPPLASLYPRNATGASAAYLAVNAVNGALGFAAVFAYGWWLVLANWAALKINGLPTPVSYLGLLFGGICILFFAIQLLAPLTLILGLVWSVWLSVVLLRDRAHMPMVAAEGS